MELSIRMIPGRLACDSFIVHASKHKNVRVLKPSGKERMSLGIQVVANHHGRVNTHVTLESSTQKIEIPIKCQIMRSVDRNGNHNYTSQHNNSSSTPIVSSPLPKTDFVPCSFNITLEHISTPLNSLPSDSPALGSNTLSTPTLPVLAKSVARRVQFATLPESKLYSGKATGQNPNMRPTNPLLSRWSENDSENEFDDLDELTEEMMRATPSLTGISKSRPHTPSFGGNWGNEKAGTPTLGIREAGNQNCVLDSSEVASPNSDWSSIPNRSLRGTPRTTQLPSPKQTLSRFQEDGDEDSDWGSSEDDLSSFPLEERVKSMRELPPTLSGVDSDSSSTQWSDSDDEAFPEEHCEQYTSNEDFEIDEGTLEMMKQNAVNGTLSFLSWIQESIRIGSIVLSLVEPVMLNRRLHGDDDALTSSPGVDVHSTDHDAPELTLESCHYCGRLFSKDRLPTHLKICSTVKHRPNERLSSIDTLSPHKDPTETPVAYLSSPLRRQRNSSISPRSERSLSPEDRSQLADVTFTRSPTSLNSSLRTHNETNHLHRIDERDDAIDSKQKARKMMARPQTAKEEKKRDSVFTRDHLNLFQCKFCGRRFAEGRIDVHQKICQQNSRSNKALPVESKPKSHAPSRATRPATAKPQPPKQTESTPHLTDLPPLRKPEPHPHKGVPIVVRPMFQSYLSFTPDPSFKTPYHPFICIGEVVYQPSSLLLSDIAFAVEEQLGYSVQINSTWMKNGCIPIYSSQFHLFFEDFFRNENDFLLVDISVDT
ncbi:hypothetical protein BLNAU_6653 [Blattamonas nauphoetae]|uniref:C2HC/C3H-type domain-containing protein n=1 Tax=Blattamonas nauphoetae TaxID=2049346 RepID=A0ABQ9Y3R1_9EUKA|nr:hypothetical protein BLNAU_6653 [Blattamonas nauphoetae]